MEELKELIRSQVAIADRLMTREVEMFNQLIQILGRQEKISEDHEKRLRYLERLSAYLVAGTAIGWALWKTFKP